MDASDIDSLAQASVLVVGDVLLDRFIDGKVSRVSPEAPVPVLRHQAAHNQLGGAANVAANLLAYGAEVVLVGLTGQDATAGELAELCGKFHRLKPRFVADPDRPTTLKTRFRSGWHQLLRVDDESVVAMAPEIEGQLVAAAEKALKEVDVVVLSDYAKGALNPQAIAAIIKAARAAGRPVLVDPKALDSAIYSGATLITPNADEMARMSGMPVDSDEAAIAACRSVLNRASMDAILVTRGEAGMTLVQRDGDAPLHVRAEALRVFDVTGAGDTVIATLAAALAAKMSLAEAVRLANVAAGIVVAKPGTATVSPRELARALGTMRMAGVASRDEAAEQVSLWREQGLTVGFTNGCFDLLHRGHIYSLEQAARRCDRLVVAVNSDASTRRLKGDGRPVQSAETRTAVLGALRFCDLVVVFDEDTPEQLITALAPDILFKGSDYDGKEIAGGAFVKARGGRVELLPLIPGFSTTQTIAAMNGGKTPG